MTLCFTICSNNFLAQAKTMLQSFQRHHPGVRTVIFLVDERDDSIDYGSFDPAEIIIVDDSVVKGFTDMVRRYTVMELNTAVRPFLYQYLSSKYADLDKTWYIDPDMYIYRSLDKLDRLLNEHDIIITPHFTEPIPLDGLKPFEDLALNYGIYNVGFLALNISRPGTKAFIEWWGERTLRFGYLDPEQGQFADQIWFNLVPLFFERILVLRDKGYNMAVWNLHERRIKNYHDDGQVELDNGEFLSIYHFSNWNYFEPGVLSRASNRFDFNNRPDLVKLYKDYHTQLQENRHDWFRQLSCRLPVRTPKKQSKFKQALTHGVNMGKKIWHRI